MAILSTPFQFITSTPPATRAFTILLILFSGANMWLLRVYHVDSFDTASVPYLTLVPALSLTYPWTLLTAAFVETTVIEVSYSTLLLIRLVSWNFGHARVLTIGATLVDFLIDRPSTVSPLFRAVMGNI